MKVLVSLQSFPLEKRKKETPFTPTCFPSFFSSHTRLLTPTPFLSALFKSKQKSHLVCLLAPSLSLTFFLFNTISLSLSHSSNFSNCFYQTWGQHFAGGNSWVRNLSWRESHVTWVCCWSPQFQGHKLITKFRFCGKNVFKTSIFDLHPSSFEGKPSNWYFLWMSPTLEAFQHDWLKLLVLSCFYHRIIISTRWAN